MKFQIIETTLKDLTEEQYNILRKMTLVGESQMRVVLDDNYRKEEVPCVIAVEPKDSTYLGWSLVITWPNDRKLVQVYVKYQHRMKGIGRSLVNHFRDRHKALGLCTRNELFCYRWDRTSQEFYNSLNMVDVWRVQV